jgi:hypothetical protein
MVGTKKLKTALASILEYVELKKPKTLAEAEHMLNAINIIAAETLLEIEIDENEARLRRERLAALSTVH